MILCKIYLEQVLKAQNEFHKQVAQTSMPSTSVPPLLHLHLESHKEFHLIKEEKI